MGGDELGTNKLHPQLLPEIEFDELISHPFSKPLNKNEYVKNNSTTHMSDSSLFQNSSSAEDRQDNQNSLEGLNTTES